jgi:hypothetical protein
MELYCRPNQSVTVIHAEILKGGDQYVYVLPGDFNWHGRPTFRPGEAPGHWENSDRFGRWTYVFDKAPEGQKFTEIE